jgi:hypothetical protein
VAVGRHDRLAGPAIDRDPAADRAAHGRTHPPSDPALERQPGTLGGTVRQELAALLGGHVTASARHRAAGATGRPGRRRHCRGAAAFAR